MRKLGFLQGCLLGGAVVGTVWLLMSDVLRQSSSHLAYGYNDVASIHLQPVPEGPPGPEFVPKPTTRDQIPLALVRELVPEPLPSPASQPVNCNSGGDLVITLNSDKTITYGPCRWPWQISQLWGAMIQAADSTEPGGPPNLAATAAQEQVRQALVLAYERKNHPPEQVSCTLDRESRDTQPLGYLCQVTRRPAGGTAMKTVSVCASLVAGRLAYARPNSADGCTGVL